MVHITEIAQEEVMCQNMATKIHYPPWSLYTKRRIFFKTRYYLYCNIYFKISLFPEWYMSHISRKEVFYFRISPPPNDIYPPGAYTNRIFLKKTWYYLYCNIYFKIGMFPEWDIAQWGLSVPISPPKLYLPPCNM